VKLDVKITYYSTFEEGYMYAVEIDRVVEGAPPEIAGLFTPPWGPGGVSDFWGFGLGKSAGTKRGLLELSDTAEDLEQIEKTSPQPGSGMGSFAPPGIITPAGAFHRLVGWTPAS
jgi:hypothetical protein